MTKKTSMPPVSYSTSSKPTVKEEVKQEVPKAEETSQTRPGSFASLISQ